MFQSCPKCGRLIDSAFLKCPICGKVVETTPLDKVSFEQALKSLQNNKDGVIMLHTKEGTLEGTSIKSFKDLTNEELEIVIRSQQSEDNTPNDK